MGKKWERDGGKWAQVNGLGTHPHEEKLPNPSPLSRGKEGSTSVGGRREAP